jgi:hypothetical protein
MLPAAERQPPDIQHLQNCSQAIIRKTRQRGQRQFPHRPIETQFPQPLRLSSRCKELQHLWNLTVNPVSTDGNKLGGKIHADMV